MRKGHISVTQVPLKARLQNDRGKTELHDK